ncbi:MAG: hypothetical protein UY63_C0015G0020 [Parcubacteria group bacterium GW2011_GWA2_51_10]|nr:MAG: hypothetical protein UY63_C0015G0020 [Parcubacteria group bacterium GW2011_GWA2_51_10]
MLFSLIAGIILGALSVLFALQNVAVITVGFFAWQITGSLALVLLTTLVTGVVITLLVLLPSLIRDDMYLSVMKLQKKELEDELAKYKSNTAPTPPPSPASF